MKAKAKSKEASEIRKITQFFKSQFKKDDSQTVVSSKQEVDHSRLPAAKRIANPDNDDDIIKDKLVVQSEAVFEEMKPINTQKDTFSAISEVINPVEEFLSQDEVPRVDPIHDDSSQTVSISTSSQKVAPSDQLSENYSLLLEPAAINQGECKDFPLSGISKHPDSDDDFIIDIPKKRSKKDRNHYAKSSFVSPLSGAVAEFANEASSIQALLADANKRKIRMQEYEDLTKRMKVSIGRDKNALNLYIDTLEKNGIDKNLIADPQDEIEMSVSLLQGGPGDPSEIYQHWNHLGARDGLQPKDLFKNGSVFSEYLSIHGLYDWLALFWEAPKNYLKALWLNAPRSHLGSTLFVNQFKTMAEFLNWPEIENSFILNIIESIGVPRRLLDESDGFDLTDFLTSDSKISQVEKNSSPGCDPRTLQLSCFLRILRELVRCIRLNYDSITQYLVILSVLSMHRESGIYVNDLFDAIATLVDLVEDSDWLTISSTWTRKLYRIVGSYMVSDQAIIFFDGCMQKYECSRLCQWGRETTFCLLRTLDIEGSQTQFDDLDFDFSSISILQSINAILSSNTLFSTKTPCYKATLRALNLVRYQMYREVILENSITKSAAVQIVKKLKLYHNRIDDRMALFIDRSIVKDELLRLANSVDLILEPIASRKDFF